MCEFDVLINGETLFKDTVYAKADENKVIRKDVLRARADNCRIVEVDVNSKRLVLSLFS